VLGSMAFDDQGGDILLQVGGWPIAAGAAAFAIGFVFHLCLTAPPAPEKAGLGGAQARIMSAFGTLEPKSPARDVADGRSDGFGARWASLEAASGFGALDEQGQRQAGHPSFGERFAFNQADESTGPSSQFSTAFDDRFAGEFRPSDANVRAAAAPSRATGQRVAAASVMPRETAAKTASKRTQPARIQLASASATTLPLGYAPTDSVKTALLTDSSLKDLTPKSTKPFDTSRTAIYDITSKTVYLPNGRRLEAHSGFGDHMDDPRYVNLRMTGPTPPNVYDLKMREAPFKGVRAIRLIPTDSSKMHGRDGILAHPYMLGPSGQSNGCVSFKDYDAFLEAFQRGEVDRMVVVERFANPPSPKTASDWLKDLFGRS
jgi:hypothetical protein